MCLSHLYQSPEMLHPLLTSWLPWTPCHCLQSLPFWCNLIVDVNCGAEGSRTPVLIALNIRITHAYHFIMQLVLCWGWLDCQHSPPLAFIYARNLALSLFCFQVSDQLSRLLKQQELQVQKFCCHLKFWCLSISLCMSSYQVATSQDQIQPLECNE